MRIIWQPLLSPWLTVPLVIAIAMLVLHYARHCLDQHGKWRYALTASRMLVLVILLVAMLGPTHVEERPVPREGSPVLVVLLDASDSMSTADVDGGTRLRFAIDRWLRSHAMDRVAQSRTVRLVAFGRDALAVSIDQTADVHTLIDPQSTDLDNALRTARAIAADHRDSAAVLLLSDGHDTAASGMPPVGNLPVFAVPIGSSIGGPDIDVQIAAMQPQLYVSESGQLRISVRQRGSAARSALLTLKVGDTSRQIVLSFDGDFAQLDVPMAFDTVGSHAISVAVDPLQGELVTTNNVATTFVDVTDERPEVLILEADPTWDTRFMAEALSRDDRLAVTQVTQVGATRTQVTRTRSRLGDDVPPDSIDQWAAYDLVVLGGSLQRMLDQQAVVALTEAARVHGTSILLTRPTSRTNDNVGGVLAGIAPLRALPGAALDRAAWPSLANDLITRSMLEDVELDAWPDGMPSLEVAAVAPTADAEVLVTATNGQPLLAMRPIGRGRVMAWNGGGLWTWAMQAPDDARGDSLVDALWMQLAHRVMGDATTAGDWSLRAEPARQRVGDAVVVTLRSRIRPLDPSTIEVFATSPSGERMVLAWPPEVTGIREHDWLLTMTEPGTYTLEALDRNAPSAEIRQARVSAYDDNEEALDTRARPDILRHIAKASGGAVLDSADPDVLPELLRDRLNNADTTEPVLTPLWTDSAPLMLVLILLGIEWIARKQLGLT